MNVKMFLPRIADATSGNFILMKLPGIGPYDICDAEIADGITESGIKNLKTWNIAEFAQFSIFWIPWKSTVLARAQFEFAQRVTLGTSK